MAKHKNQNSVPDPRDIYKLALRYSEASKVLESHSKSGSWGASAPRLLVDSFAIELYLKCLYVLDTNSKPLQQHNWVTLYEALGSHTKSLIREQFNTIVNEDPVLRHIDVINPDASRVTDFSRSLHAAANTFDKRRYLYETPADSEWFYAHLLHEAIRSVTGMDVRLAGILAEEVAKTIEV